MCVHIDGFFCFLLLGLCWARSSTALSTAHDGGVYVSVVHCAQLQHLVPVVRAGFASQFVWQCRQVFVRTVWLNVGGSIRLDVFRHRCGGVASF